MLFKKDCSHLSHFDIKNQTLLGFNERCFLPIKKLCNYDLNEGAVPER